MEMTLVKSLNKFVIIMLNNLIKSLHSGDPDVIQTNGLVSA